MTQHDPNQPESGPGSTPPPQPSAGPEPVGYASPATGGYPNAYGGPPPTKDAMTMALLCHLLGMLTSFLGPVILWAMKKDAHPFIDDQGKEALNFQLTLLIGYIIAAVLSCVLIGLFLIPVIIVLDIVFSIIAMVQSNKGVAYRYPISIRIIK